MHYPKVLERVDFPEQIFHRSFSLGAPDNSCYYATTRTTATTLTTAVANSMGPYTQVLGAQDISWGHT